MRRHVGPLGCEVGQREQRLEVYLRVSLVEPAVTRATERDYAVGVIASAARPRSQVRRIARPKAPAVDAEPAANLRTLLGARGAHGAITTHRA